MGLTHGVLGAKLVTDLITGVESPWAELYRPQRKPLSSPGTFLSENLNAVAQYAALLTPGEVSSVDDIAVDCGAILRKGLTKVAAYRDKEGQIHQCSGALHPSAGCRCVERRREVLGLSGSRKSLLPRGPGTDRTGG